MSQIGRIGAVAQLAALAVVVALAGGAGPATESSTRGTEGGIAQGRRAAAEPASVVDDAHQHDLARFREVYYKDTSELDPSVAGRLVEWAHAHPDDPEGLFAGAMAVETLSQQFAGERPQVVKMLRRACDSQYAPAFAEMASLLLNGRVVEQNVPEATTLLRRGIERGDPVAPAYMGWILETGLGGSRDVVGARDCFQKSVDGGCARAYLSLATACEILGDRAAFIRALEAGTKAGALNSIARLGIYKLNEQVPPDPAAGFPLIRRAAEHGVMEAQYWLGVCYRDGIDTTRDAKASVEWLTKSWNAGYSPAGVDLAMACLKGEGVPQDREMAMKLLSVADKQGNGDASYQLGMLYLNGPASKDDLAKAKELLQRAVDRGKKKAEEPLAKLK